MQVPLSTVVVAVSIAVAVASVVVPSMMIPVRVSVGAVITAASVVRPVVALNTTGEGHGGAEKDEESKLPSHIHLRIR